MHGVSRWSGEGIDVGRTLSPPCLFSSGAGYAYTISVGVGIGVASGSDVAMGVNVARAAGVTGAATVGMEKHSRVVVSAVAMKMAYFIVDCSFH